MQTSKFGAVCDGSPQRPCLTRKHTFLPPAPDRRSERQEGGWSDAELSNSKKKGSVLLYLALAFLLIGLGGCCIPKHPVESALVLQDIAARGKPSALKRQVAEPASKEITYRIDNRRSVGDLYLPTDHTPEAGLVLVPGVAKAGRRDARLVALARTLARARFAVLVPELETVKRLKVSAHDAQQIADAARHLLSQPDLVSTGRVGIAAASYAVGPALLAALQSDLNNRIGFILSIGGYYDVTEALTFAITGYYRDRTQPESGWRYLKADGQVKLVFLISNIEYVRAPHDRKLLQEIARRKLENPEAPVGDLTAWLRKEGQAFYRLLTATQPQQVSELMKGLPRGVNEHTAQLDLSRHDLSRLRAHLILIHGRNDRSIPFTESKALAAAVPDARLYLVNNLAHVDLKKGSVIDSLRLWCAMDELLSQRGRTKTAPSRDNGTL